MEDYSATALNLTDEPPPFTMQQIVLEAGGISQLVSLTQSMDPVLRLNSVWALKNLLFMADSATKQRVMREVGYQTLGQLVQDAEEDVQEQALMLFRNLVHGKVTLLHLSPLELSEDVQKEELLKNSSVSSFAP